MSSVLIKLLYWIDPHVLYLCILRSTKDNKLYIGFTDDLIKRIAHHKKGLVASTKNRLPLELIYYEGCLNKHKAIEREKYFKTGYGRRFLKNRI